jgi:hypothetical protein
MADEIDRANVISVWFCGYRWYAQIGPKDLGLIADGRTAAVAVASLAVKCGSLGWPFDESWKPR